MIVLAVPVEYPDSSLTLLSAPAGWSDTEKRYVPIPAVVVPNPTIFALDSKIFPTLFSICSFIKSFSNLAVIIPTALWLFDKFLSTYICDIEVSVPSKSTIISL